MRLSATVKRPQKMVVAQGVPLPAPVGGWDAISPLANMPVDRAVQIDNWICRPGWIEPRNGYIKQATGLGAGNVPVETVMAYNGLDGSAQLFGAAAGTIYDCTSVGAAIATIATGLQSSRLQYVMFATPSNDSYLMATNGTDDPWSYDGTTWAQRPITIGFATGSIVWAQNFLPGETIDLNGTVVTFVTGTPTGNEVDIGANLATSLSNLLTFLQGAGDANIRKFTYSTALDTTLLLTAAVSNTIGNSLTIAAGFATGSITFGANPSNGDTIDLNGSIIEFVTSGAGGAQVNISTSLAGTLTTLLSVLQDSSDGNVNEFTYTVTSTQLLVQAASAGVLGNSLTIGASAATPSGPTLVGGSTAAASGATLTGGGDSFGIVPSDFIAVNSYQSRLWFVPINSTNVVYLQTVGGVQGSASVFPLGQELKRGGYIMAIGTWTVDTRQSVDEYIAFISSRGEVVVYQGTDPTTATTFALTGVYQLGAPISRRCFLRISGDLQIITVDGVVGMSEMLSTDRAAANRVSLTSIIMNQMALAAQSYKNNFGWQVIEYALGTLAILNIPVRENQQQMQFVMNTITGAWSRFIGLDPTGKVNASYGINANCWEVDANDNIFFGGNDGTVYRWNVGSGDGAQPITAVVQGAYNSFGNAAQIKRYTMLQALITTTGNPQPAIGVNIDFDQSNILSTEETTAGTGALWGAVTWGNFTWGGAAAATNNWLSVQGVGHYVSIVTQITTKPNPGNPEATVTLQLNGWNILAESGAFV